MILAVTLALADPKAESDGDMAPCQTAPGVSRPADGSIDVPINAIFVVAIADPQCEPYEWRLDLYKAGQSEAVLQAVVTTDLGYLELVPTRELDPLTEYTLTVTDTWGYGISESYTITTGESTYVAESWQPTIDDAYAGWLDMGDRLTVEAEIGVPLGQADNTLVRAGHVGDASGTDPDWNAAAFGFGGASSFVSWFEYYDENPVTDCIAAQGRNLDGSWTETTVLCFDTEIEVLDTGEASALESRECGCQSAGGTSGIIAGFVGTLFGVLRRRSRG